MKDKPIPACLIVDDFPAQASYWMREQLTAFGYYQSEADRGFAWNWRAHHVAALCPLRLAEAFADFVEEFDVRGKWTVLPCPAGLGRLDRGVRGYSASELQSILRVVRERLAPRFDITPEGLTHSMAFDLEQEALLPHAETPWMTHLCATGQTDRLRRYLDSAWRILANVGIRAHGLTVGSMGDPSGIAKGESLARDRRDVLASVLLDVEASFNPALRTTFLYTGAAPITEAGREHGYPERVYTQPGRGDVYDLQSPFDDVLLPAYNGTADVAAEAEKQISRDLSSGALVDMVESGRALVLTVHNQTLNSLNTGLGLALLREVVRRLTERYGRRLVWLSASDLVARHGVKAYSPKQASNR